MRIRAVTLKKGAVMRCFFACCCLYLSMNISGQPTDTVQAGVTGAAGAVAVISPLPYELPYSTGTGMNADSSQLFRVNISRGKLNGVWESWYHNGQRCDSGSLVNNIPDGEWKIWNEQGHLLAIRYYSSGKFWRITAEMMRYHPKRSFYYLSEWYQRNRVEALSQLDAVNSFPESKGRISARTLGKHAEQNAEKGAVYKPVFVQCLHEGLFMNYFPGGLVKDSGYYRDGLRTGKWIHRDEPDAGWYHGAYHHGKRIKEWKLYNREGRLEEIIHYNHRGEINWRKKINRQ